MNMQCISLPTTRETTWKGNPANREGPRKVHWQRQFRDKGLPLQLQFDSLGCVVNSSNSRGFRQAGEPKQKISIENPKDVVHENPVGKHVPPDGRYREPADLRTSSDRFRPIEKDTYVNMPKSHICINMT